MPDIIPDADLTRPDATYQGLVRQIDGWSLEDRA